MKNTDNISYLLDKYNYSVPRYTSFPPATQFCQNETQSDYIDLLSGLSPSDPVSLYVHIPFCHELCLFCGCHTKIVSNYSPIESYLKLLLSEIELVGKTLESKLPVNLIHFGGGSPNYLKPKDFKSIIDKFSECFDINENTQIDVESDPRYLNAGIIDCFAEVGVTRVSLGVQDFNSDVQKVINRIQPFDMVEKCVANLRAKGIDQINFDLMIGLPNQTVESVSETAKMAASLSPNRLAVFPYAHVPWMKKHQKLLEKYPMADGYERFLMNEAVDDILLSSGYKAIGTDHYAREIDPLCRAQENKQLRRNFQGYTTDISAAIIGFGLSSISSFDNAYIQNTTDPVIYRNSIKGGKFSMRRSCFLSNEDQDLRALIEEIMCNFEVDLDSYMQTLEQSYDLIKDRLSKLEDDGLVILDGRFLQITDLGKPFTRVVASCFDPYFQIQENKHAKAI